MITQYISLKRWDWKIFVYYGAGKEDFAELADALICLDCNKKDIKKALRVLRKKNTGFTFSNSDYKTSVVCIGEATDVGQFVDTAAHEAKHVQSHICQFYGVDETTETAAYLMGHLVHKMYMMLQKILRSYI